MLSINSIFLHQDWRGGKRARKQVAEQVPTAPQGAVAMDELSGEAKYSGMSGIKLAPSKAEIESAGPATVDAAKGLKPLPESLIAAAAPGLEAPPEAAGGLIAEKHSIARSA